MSKNKCCGNCARSYAKDMDGYCACVVDNHFTSCDEVCDNHILSINGWIEITTDNEHELTDELIDRAVIGWRDSCNRQHIVAFADCAMGVGTMAKHGGYWYYVLPELKIE